MKKIILIFTLALFSLSSLAANVADFMKDAQNKANKENKSVLLVFSGLEWCRPCQLLDSNIFKSKEFEDYAKENLVVVDVDTKMNRMVVVSIDGKEIEVKPSEINDFIKALMALDKKYPHRGVPYTLLLDKNGEIVYSVIGYPGQSPKEFIANLQKN